VHRRSLAGGAKAQPWSERGVAGSRPAFLPRLGRHMLAQGTAPNGLVAAMLGLRSAGSQLIREKQEKQEGRWGRPELLTGVPISPCYTES